ncbi:MAG: ribosome assembly factor SBDS [Methanocellales archaeon]|nr:ribosome assembly factor SBDS [Methanocellales archaeon]MDD3291612.1 ribosome assembly factor SBDS [Methanocellales archaeon]MDD5235181.1 ribosome assembly factor SBDS [Methanocellales archaeon]MDD5485395.1 ribosome assembly factor SBDS [Methanocellales archaeon]
MVTLDEAVVARYKTHGLHFEILVDPEAALALKRGEDVNIEKILAVEDIFEDASAGDRVADDKLMTVFGTTEVYAISKEIISHGEIQLTSEQRRRMQENKRKRVIDIITRNAFNPQTRAPHPPSRIEKAMEEAGIHIDPFKSDDEMVNEVMKKIRPIIPIRFDEVNIAVKIPAEYAGKSYGAVQGFGQLVKEEWQSDGSWVAIIKIPAGIQGEFYDLVNNLTKGNAETKLMRQA